MSSATNTNYKNQSKHKKCDCAVFKSSLKNFNSKVLFCDLVNLSSKRFKYF